MRRLPCFRRSLVSLLLPGLFALALPVMGQDDPAHPGDPDAPAEAATAGPGAKVGGLPPCADLPVGELSDDELAKLVPEGTPGKVRIRWRTESQEENYGFNIFRGKQAGGPYDRVNTSIIPGEGSTNIPTDYCFEDTGVERGETYFYYIESVSNAGVKETLEGTKDTRVQVKTVEEERTWLKAKGLEALQASTAETTGTVTADSATSLTPNQQ